MGLQSTHCGSRPHGWRSLSDKDEPTDFDSLWFAPIFCGLCRKKGSLSDDFSFFGTPLSFQVQFQSHYFETDMACRSYGAGWVNKASLVAQEGCHGSLASWPHVHCDSATVTVPHFKKIKFAGEVELMKLAGRAPPQGQRQVALGPGSRLARDPSHESTVIRLAGRPGPAAGQGASTSLSGCTGSLSQIASDGHAPGPAVPL